MADLVPGPLAPLAAHHGGQNPTVGDASIRWMPLSEVLANWRPGSFDRTWQAEFADLGSQARIGEMQLRTWDADGTPRDELCLRMLRGEPVEPITLGWDGGWWNGRWWRGRVWAGHHRLWLHHLVGWPEIRVDVVPPGERRPWPASHCAPSEGVLVADHSRGGPSRG